MQDLHSVIRDGVNKSWLVKAGYRSKTFLDNNYGGEQNSYVEAFNYAFSMVDISKRRHATERNVVFVEKITTKGVSSKYVRITRPLGGYKFFKIKPTSHNSYSMAAIELAIQEANNWFRTEREKCQADITSKNIDTRQQRKSLRHSFLFGDPLLGQT